MKTQTKQAANHIEYFAHKIAYVIIVLLLLELCSASAQLWKVRIEIAKELSIALTPIHKSSAKAAIDWKTYTNSQYGFEFKLPQDWQTEEIKSPSTTDFYLKISKNNTEYVLVIKKAPTSLVLKDYILGPYKNCIPDMESPCPDSIPTVTNFTSQAISGLKLGDDEYYFVNKGFIYVLSYEILNPPNIENQILSTFKFTK